MDVAIVGWGFGSGGGSGCRVYRLGKGEMVVHRIFRTLDFKLEVVSS